MTLNLNDYSKKSTAATSPKSREWKMSLELYVQETESDSDNFKQDLCKLCFCQPSVCYSL